MLKLCAFMVDRDLRSLVRRYGKACSSRSKLFLIVHVANLVSFRCKSYVKNGWNLQHIVWNIFFQYSNSTILKERHCREALQHGNVIVSKEKKGTMLLNI